MPQRLFRFPFAAAVLIAAAPALAQNAAPAAGTQNAGTAPGTTPGAELTAPTATTPAPGAPASQAPANQAPANQAPAATDQGAADAMPPNIPELSNNTTDQVPLTTDLVQRLIDSWPEMSALASDFTDQYGIDEDAPDPAAVFGAWASHPEAKAKIDAVIAKHGFKDLDEWTKVANSILIAYDWDDDLVDPKKIEEAVHDIDKTPGLSQAEKDALIAQVREQAASAEESRPLPGNREVIAPFSDRIAKGIGEESSGDQ